MPIVDILLLCLIGAFVLFGFFFGFIHTLGSFIGSFVGLGISLYLLDPLYEKVGFLFGTEGVAKVVIFIIAFLIISRLIGVLFWALDHFYHFFTWIPFTSFINRLLGGLLGFLEGLVIVGVVIYYADAFLPEGMIRSAVETSWAAGYVLSTLGQLLTYIPEPFRSWIPLEIE